MSVCTISGCSSRQYARGWCTKHYQRWRRHGDPTAYVRLRYPDTLWTKINEAGPLPVCEPSLGHCWIWSGQLDRDGYGQFTPPSGSHKVHRHVYELLVGAVPDGLTLDHLCRVTACCNPRHLEPVTSVENVMRGTSPAAQNARKTRCKNGHPYDFVTSQGARACRRCKRADDRAFYAKKRVA